MDPADDLPADNPESLTGHNGEMEISHLQSRGLQMEEQISGHIATLTSPHLQPPPPEDQTVTLHSCRTLIFGNNIHDM